AQGLPSLGPSSDPITGGRLPQYRPDGQTTNISKGIREALRTLQGNPIAGIVLVTDGQYNDGDDPAAAAEFAAQQNVPLFVVGVGDSSKPRNIRVADVYPSSDSVWRQDPFTIEAPIQQQGYEGDRVRVE